ncbi:hypothetical protein Gorai_005851 [Gossypium raimondii]|uniref:Zinc knuckle CX2CX4HX4C domain-containing protein n=1 Tax=Gossypium raimondii TaxID=29730 RepID=A0A7J8QED6_GOSRA|nr:hypothetical protein [Gossypium raimondii]
MAILLDLNKPLVSKIKVDGQLQRVEYESIPNICFSCWHFEHLRESCSFVPSHDGRSIKRTVQMADQRNQEALGSRFKAFHDLWDESQINVRDSDPVDPARLKGKGVAIYNNPLGREKKQVAKDLGLAGPSVRIESQWNQNQAVGGSPKTGSRSIKLNRHLMAASFNNSEPNSISPLANVNVINSRDILNQLSIENSSREIVPLMQGQPMSLWKRQNLNIPMRDMISVDPLPTYDEHFNILASLKIGDPKFLRRGSHTLRGKGSKFKVKASARESIAEAMTTIVDRIGSDSLVTDLNCLQGTPSGSSEATNLDV